MPIFPKHKTIFLHVPKTAGSTIEKALGLETAQMLDTRKSPHAPQHRTFRELKVRIPPDIFSSYFKFAITRHPVERLVSHFYWNPDIKPKTKKRFTKLVDFAAECGSSDTYRTVAFNDHLIPQVFYTRGADYVGKYEELEETIKEIWKRLPDPHHPKPVVREIKRFQPKCRKLLDVGVWNRIVDIYRSDFKELHYAMKPPKWLVRRAVVRA